MANDYRGATSTLLSSVAGIDAISRAVANIGVPAAIAFFILAQITPRLDSITANQVSANTTLTLIAASCSRPAPVVSNLGANETR
jgi:hypothetical protein